MSAPEEFGALLTQIEAGRYLHKSPKKIREWTKAGTIPVLYDAGSNRPMYPRAALDAMFDELGRLAARKAVS